RAATGGGGVLGRRVERPEAPAGLALLRREARAIELVPRDRLDVGTQLAIATLDGAAQPRQLEELTRHLRPAPASNRPSPCRGLRPRRRGRCSPAGRGAVRTGSPHRGPWCC